MVCICVEKVFMEVSGCVVVVVIVLSDVSGKVGGVVGNIFGFIFVNGMLGKLEFKVMLGRWEGIVFGKLIEWFFFVRMYLIVWIILLL